MRKQTKLVAVLSAAALLAIGASMTSFAAWEEQDGSWVWLNSQGERVTETWKKSGNQYFWLDENGEMATESLIEDGDSTYYVDANGARVINQWVAVENDDLCEEDVDTIYFRFGSTGKAIKPGTSDSHKITTIDGKKYIFDADGHMLSGWQEINENIYYLGDENEGWAYTGWNFLEISETAADSGNDYDDEEWFYFASSGKAHKKARKYISGAYYAFDDYGVMDDRWVTGTPWSAATGTDSTKVASINLANKSYYKEEVGNQVIGWNYYYDNNDESGDPFWYYLVGSNTGVPFNYNASAALKSSGADRTTATVYKYVAADIEIKDGAPKPYTQLAAKVIKSKTYLFDSNGKMLTGVYVIPTGVVYRESGSSNLDAGIYYFNKTSGSGEGQMMTGKQSITYDGDTYHYYFQKTGKAYVNTIADGSFYNSAGTRVNAEDGNSNAVINISNVAVKGAGDNAPGGLNNRLTGEAIVSANGKIKKAGKVTIDGWEYTVSNYIVTDKKAK